MQALQLIFISAGTGRVEWKNASHEVGGGQGFFVLPGLWHRYRPNAGRGWTEHWIEVKGNLIDEWLHRRVIDPEHLLFKPREAGGLAKLFGDFHSLCRRKPAGYRPVLTGMAITILAESLRHASHSRDGKPDGVVSGRVGAALHRLRNECRNPPSMAEIARHLGISYPTFLRHFRKETGLKPKEYLEQIRMSQAADLMMAGHLEVKEVSARLGFHSAFHFSARFKKHYGLSPVVWRARNGGKQPLYGGLSKK